MDYGLIDYEVIGEGTPVLVIHGWGIIKIILLVPCMIPGVRQGRAEPLTVVEKEDL